MKEHEMMNRRPSAIVPEENRKRSTLGEFVDKHISRDRPIFLPVSSSADRV